MHEKATTKKGGVWKLLRPQKTIDWNSFLKLPNIANETDLAEEFAMHFRNKVDKLKKPSNASDIFLKLKDFYHDAPSWDIITCSTNDVSKAIDELRPSDSCGPDLISNRLIKSLKFEALEYITHVINKSISEGVFPEVWKCCKVIPTHKKGDKKNISNYRPICLFSTLGKLLEGVIRKQFTVHLERILPANMYGFRPGRSVQDAIQCVMDKIRKYRAAGHKVAILAMDASSAFDLVQHDIILRTLEVVGAGPQFTNWTKSYLTGCQNFVQIGESRSSIWSNDTGSGQGRRLSPDYFNLVWLSQALFSIISDSFGYADDGLDVVYGSNAEECTKKLQLVANERVQWYANIGLSLNPAKSEIVGFGYTPDPIDIDGNLICPKAFIKFLGVTIESDLKWTKQISSICNKIRCAAGRIRTEARHFTLSDKRLLYNGLIQSQVFFNASTVLPTATKSDIHDIQVACNSGLRAVWGAPKYGYIDVTGIRKRLNIPSVEMIKERKLLESGWNTHINSDFAINSEGPLTRSKKLKNLPHPKQNGQLGKISGTLSLMAWNRLPLEIKNETKSHLAKRKIIKFINATMS